MKIALHGGFLLMCSVLQATWLNYITLFDVKPNLFLVYVVVLSFFCNSKIEGAVVGAVFGLILDFIIGRVVGINMILSLLIGFTVTLFCERVIRKNSIFITMLSILIITIVYESVYYFFAFLFTGGMGYWNAMIAVILPESIFNVIVSVPAYYILGKFTQYLYTDKGEGLG